MDVEGVVGMNQRSLMVMVAAPYIRVRVRRKKLSKMKEIHHRES